MSATQRLALRQRQALAMTPEMLQSLRLLQASQGELAAFIEAECERNPLITYQNNSPDTAPLDATLRAARQADQAIRRVFSPGPFGTARGTPDARAAGPASREMPVDPLERLAAGPSLGEHLESQLAATTADAALLAAGRYIVRNLTDSGYLADDIDHIADATGLPVDTVRAALALVQGLDPTGIAARDLAECLTLQLRESGQLDGPMALLLGRLDLLARRDIASLCRICGVDEAALWEMVAAIRRLDPKPGLRFASTRIEALVPDVHVSCDADGLLRIALNGGAAPRVAVDRAYLSTIAASARSPSDKAYLSDCVKSASALSRMLDRRATTVFTVAAEIVRRQDAFFRGGPEHLRPLNLHAVAEATGLHASTISRVAANKVIGSERGAFPMRFFFTTALGGKDGVEGHSATAVRHRIAALIAGETSGTVLSDEAIARELCASGIMIARRTVAKYREALRLPSSARRRGLAKSKRS